MSNSSHDELIADTRLKPYQDALQATLPQGFEKVLTSGYIGRAHHDDAIQTINLFYAHIDKNSKKAKNEAEQMSPEFAEAFLILRRVAGYLGGECELTAVSREEWLLGTPPSLQCQISFPSDVTPDALRNAVELFKATKAYEIYKKTEVSTRIAYDAAKRALHFGSAYAPKPDTRLIAYAIMLKEFGPRLFSADRAGLIGMLTAIDSKVGQFFGAKPEDSVVYLLKMVECVNKAFAFDAELPGREILVQRICEELPTKIIDDNSEFIERLSIIMKQKSDELLGGVRTLHGLLGNGRAVK